MKQKLTLTVIFLIILLLIRALFQFLTLFQLKEIGLVFLVVSLFAILYVISVVGIYYKQKWAAILVIIIAIVDLMVALTMGGASSVGAGLVDLAILFLAYKEYQLIKS